MLNNHLEFDDDSCQIFYELGGSDLGQVIRMRRENSFIWLEEELEFLIF